MSESHQSVFAEMRQTFGCLIVVTVVAAPITRAALWGNAGWLVAGGDVVVAWVVLSVVSGLLNRQRRRRPAYPGEPPPLMQCRALALSIGAGWVGVVGAFAAVAVRATFGVPEGGPGVGLFWGEWFAGFLGGADRLRRSPARARPCRPPAPL